MANDFLQGDAALSYQIALVNAIALKCHFRTIRLDRPPFHIHNRSVFTNRNIDSGGLLFSFLIENFQSDIVIEGAPNVLSHELVQDVNIPEEGFNPGVLLHNGRLHVALLVGHGKPADIDWPVCEASDRARKKDRKKSQAANIQSWMSHDQANNISLETIPLEKGRSFRSESRFRVLQRPGCFTPGVLHRDREKL